MYKRIYCCTRVRLRRVYIRLLITAYQNNSSGEGPLAQRSETIDVHDSYDIITDSEHGRYPELRKIFSDYVKEHGFYDVERRLWGDPTCIKIASISNISGMGAATGNGKSRLQNLMDKSV